MVNTPQASLPLINQTNVPTALLTAHDPVIDAPVSVLASQLAAENNVFTFVPVTNSGNFDPETLFPIGQSVRYTVPLGPRGTYIKTSDAPANTLPTSTADFVLNGEDGEDSGLPYTYDASSTDLTGTPQGGFRLDAANDQFAFHRIARVRDNTDYQNYLTTLVAGSTVEVSNRTTRNIKAKFTAFSVTDSGQVKIVQWVPATSTVPSPFLTDLDDVVVSISPPGPPGLAGTSTTTTQASFNQPAALANIQVTVANTAVLATGSTAYIVGGGYYRIISVDSAALVTLQNLGLTGNAAPSTAINSGALVTPAGREGIDGIDGTAATIVISAVDTLAAGASATMTEEPGSTNQARDYRAGIPRGVDGTSTGQPYTVSATVTAAGEIGFNGGTFSVHQSDRITPTPNDLLIYWDGIESGSKILIQDETSASTIATIELTANLTVASDIFSATGTLAGTLPADGTNVRVSVERSVAGPPGSGTNINTSSPSVSTFLASALSIINGGLNNNAGTAEISIWSIYDPALATPVDQHIYIDLENLLIGIFFQAINGGAGGYIFFGNSI